MELSPFTRHDWQGFAGAEGDNPLIGYFDTPSAVVILDDLGIQIILYQERDEEWEHVYNYTNKTRKMSERIVAGMTKADLNPESLAELGFERIY